MFACKYGDEPLDIKLMLLYVCKRWYCFVLAVILTAGVFAGAYYLKTFVFAEDPSYVAKSVLYLDYNDAVKLDNIYVNDYTWQQLVKTDAVIEFAMEELPDDITRAYLDEVVFAGLESDVRIVNLRVTTNDPERSVLIAQKFEEALVQFGTMMDDIDGITIFTHATQAETLPITNRILKVTALGAVLGAVFSLLGLFLLFVTDDSIYVPITFERRFSIPVIGMFTREGTEVWAGECALNIKSCLRECEQVVISGVQEDCEGQQVIQLLDKNQIALPRILKFSEAHAVNTAPEHMEELLGYDGIVLAVAAGSRNMRVCERTIQFIQKQGGTILGVILYHGDRKLLRAYYRFTPIGNTKKEEDT